MSIWIAGIAAAAVLGGGATFYDPGGDADGAAPDITAVSIADSPSGSLTVSVTAPGVGRPGTALGVNLDTDRNPGTGLPYMGFEYQLHYENVTTERSAVWVVDGALWTDRRTPLTFTRAGDILTWTLNRVDIGNPAAFDFFVQSGAYTPDWQMLGVDVAPSYGGRWTYELGPYTSPPPPPPPATTTPKPSIGAPSLVPVRPAAGKRLRVVFPLENAGGASLTCDPKIGGRLVAHTEQLAPSRATLSLTVPTNAKGRVLQVRVRLVADGGTATRTASFAVR